MTPATLDIPTLARTLDRFEFVLRYCAWATRTKAQRELTYGLRVRRVRGAWQLEAAAYPDCPPLTRGTANHVYQTAYRQMGRTVMDGEVLRAEALETSIAS